MTVRFQADANLNQIILYQTGNDFKQKGIVEVIVL